MAASLWTTGNARARKGKNLIMLVAQRMGTGVKAI